MTTEAEAQADGIFDAIASYIRKVVDKRLKESTVATDEKMAGLERRLSRHADHLAGLESRLQRIEKGGR